MFRSILKVAWPLIVANSFWNLQLTVDRIFLGMYSTEALGAAMAVMGVFWVPMALLQQTASYVTAFVAQYMGAQENEKVGHCVWQAIYVSVVGGILFLLQNFLSADFFAMVGHSPSIQQLEVEYFNAVAYSALPTALVAVVSGFYTGLGRTQMIMLINFVGVALNVILDYLLIFGFSPLSLPALGVAGAGYATALANAGAAIFGLWIMFGSSAHQAFRFSKSWRWNGALMWQFLKFGIPSGLQWALEGLAFTVFLIIMGRLPNGEVALAASSIAVTVMMLSVLPTMGVSQAVMTLVGQSLGARKTDQAELIAKNGVKISFAYMVCAASTFLLIPDFYVNWFRNDSDPSLWHAVAELTPQLLMILAVFTVFDSIYFNISAALKGAGDTRYVSALALILPWPLMILPTYLLKDTENAVVWAWWFCVLYSICLSVLLAARFREGGWKSMSVIHPS